MRSIVMVMVVAHRLVQAGWGLHVGLHVGLDIGLHAGVQMGLQVMLQYNIMPGARQPAGFGRVCPRAAPAQADTAADYRACPDKVRT